MAPSSTITPRHLGERHVELLDSLEHIVLEEGFQQFTVADLAARLSCSKRTLYEIAPTKQALVLGVMNRWLQRIRDIGREGAESCDDPVERIDAYLRPGVTESRRAGPRFLADVQAWAPALELLEAHQRERAEALKGILEHGITRGRFRSLHPQLVADIFLASVNRINEPAVLAAAKISFSEAFAEFFALIEHGIVATPESTLSPTTGSRRAGKKAVAKAKSPRTKPGITGKRTSRAAQS